MPVRTAMKWSAVLLVTALGLCACIGAALVKHQGEQSPTGSGGAGDARRVEQGPPVDRTRPTALVPRPAPELLGDRAFEHARKLVSFGPRYGGQPGWSQQLDYIERTLQDLGIQVERDTWTDRRELRTFSNVIATLPGRRRERIVLACHHDTKCTTGHDDPAHNFHFVGANDGASGVALLLALAPVLQREPRGATLQLVFFDGEESLDWAWNEAARALFGSKRFVKRHRDALLLGEEARIEAMVLLDMVGRSDLHIQDELYSTPELRKIAWSAAMATGHGDHFYREAQAASDDHTPFLEVGIPSVDLIDLKGNPHWHAPSDTLQNMSPRSLQIVADVVLTMLPEVERVYVPKRD